MYHRVRRSFLEILGSPLIHLPQQAVLIFADKGGLFGNLFHGRKSSGGPKAAMSWHDFFGPLIALYLPVLFIILGLILFLFLLLSLSQA